MRAEPQAAPYRPGPQIVALADWLGDPVDPADFPDHRLRLRNGRRDKIAALRRMGEALGEPPMPAGQLAANAAD